MTRERFITGAQFVVEKKGERNPVALELGESIGRRATEAYLHLLNDQKKDITRSEDRYSYEDIDNFGEFLGFACKGFKSMTLGSRKRYPNGYGLVAFNDDKKDILSRAALRVILGADADTEIAEFYEEIGEISP